MVNHGVDCVIGTVEIVYRPLMNFWYYQFYKTAEQDTSWTIARCAQAAYNYAIKDLVYVHPELDSKLDPANLTDFNTIKTYFARDTVSIFSYDDLIRIVGDRDIKLFPARFGATMKCPE